MYNIKVRSSACYFYGIVRFATARARARESVSVSHRMYIWTALFHTLFLS